MNAPAFKYPLYETGHHRLTPDERAEFNAQFDVICNSGQFRNGQWSAALSGKLCEMTGYRYAIPTDSGTTALAIIAAWVNKIHRLRNVLVPNLTFQATYNALARGLPSVTYLPMTPGDTNGTNLNIGTLHNEATMNMIPGFREVCESDAIVTVGLGGAHNNFTSPDVIVIEDCCQDWISKPHTGNHRAISFDPSKVVTGLSGGGAILTDSVDLAHWASRAISNDYQAEWDSGISPVFGKHTITEVDAMHVLMMLTTVNERLEDRRKILTYYKERLGEFLLGEDFSNHDASKALVWLPNFSESEWLSIKELRDSQGLADYRWIYRRHHNGGADIDILLSLPLSERKGINSMMEDWLDFLAGLLQRLKKENQAANWSKPGYGH